MHHSNFWELALIGSSSSLHSGIWFSCDPPLVHKIGTTYYLLPLPTNPQLYQPFAKVPQAEEWLKLFKVPNWIEPFNFLKYLIMFPIWLPCPIAISIFLQGQTSYEVIQMCNPRLAFLVSPRIGVPWNLDELWPRDVTGIMLVFFGESFPVPTQLSYFKVNNQLVQPDLWGLWHQNIEETRCPKSWG